MPSFNPYALLAEILVFVTVIALAALGLHQYNSALKDGAVAEDRATANDLVAKQAIEGQKHIQALAEEAFEAARLSDERRNRAERDNEKLKEGYAALRKSDKSVDDVLSIRIPEPVRRLRKSSSAPSGGNPAGAVRDPAGAIQATPGR